MSSARVPRAARRRIGVFRPIGRPIIWFWAAINVLVIGWITVQSFRNGTEMFSDPFGLPTTLRVDNFVSAWSTSQLGSSFANTALVTISAAVTVLVLACPAAYALARSSRRSASPLIALFAIGMGIPIQAAIIPIFVLMQTISSIAFDAFGWWDQRISLYMIYVATALPFATFLLTGFVRALPEELEEAAALDGASPARTFRQIMIPLAAPGLITTFILTLLGIWNETLLALVLITETSQYMLPQALLGLYGTMQYTSNWGGLFAGVVIVVMPMLIIYALLGRRIVEGMSVGAIK